MPLFGTVFGTVILIALLVALSLLLPPVQRLARLSRMSGERTAVVLCSFGTAGTVVLIVLLALAVASHKG
jgi:hypothetical protein